MCQPINSLMTDKKYIRNEYKNNKRLVLWIYLLMIKTVYDIFDGLTTMS